MSEDIFLPLVRRWDRRTALDSVERDAILSLPFTLRSLERGAYIGREGEASSFCGLVVSGFASRHKVVADGARQIVAVHMRGEFVDLQNALLALLDHNVQTLSRVQIAFIPQAALHEIGYRHPRLGQAMWLDTLIDSAVFREWLVNVGRRNALSRVAHLFCELALRMQVAGLAEDHEFVLPLTQEQIADCCGLTSVHVNRVLRTLRDERLIALSTRSLRILDWERLRDIGDFTTLYLQAELGQAA